MVNLLRPLSVSTHRLGTITGLWGEQSPYDRRALNTGIVHFGPGRFFRGHLAYIIHNYLSQKESQEQRWGICGGQSQEPTHHYKVETSEVPLHFD
jgi:hypothetical protein